MRHMPGTNKSLYLLLELDMSGYCYNIIYGIFTVVLSRVAEFKKLSKKQ